MLKVAFDVLNYFADQYLQILSIKNQAFQNNLYFFIQRAEDEFKVINLPNFILLTLLKILQMLHLLDILFQRRS
jgi:hypothetical protein